jgi:hypothetical protein
MPRWTEQARHDRVIHKALSRPLKVKAVKEVQTVLAGLPVEPPSKVPATSKAAPAIPPAAGLAGGSAMQPASELSVPRDGASVEETSYTDLLFDYRSVRSSW